MNIENLQKLASLYGIELFYWDIWGKQQIASEDTILSLLNAMGLSIKDDDDVLDTIKEYERKKWQMILPSVKVIRVEGAERQINLQIPLNLPAININEPFKWQLVEENGKMQEGYILPSSLEVTNECEIEGEKIIRCQIWLEIACSFGYHTFKLFSHDSAPKTPLAEMQLIAAPKKCFTPLTWQQNGRVFGIAVQLYAVRSLRNWGMGDLTDLLNLVEIASKQGADIIGINPLNALFIQNPLHKSPYSPSSRRFFNWIYIDVEAVPDLYEDRETQNLIKGESFQTELERLRQTALVDYAGVSQLKKQALLLLFASFKRNHLQKQTAYAQEFHKYKKVGSVEEFALFEALQQAFHDENPYCWGWHVWQEEYKNPGSPAVKAFLKDHQEEIDFFVYLQWQFERQLDAVIKRCHALGMSIGLYGDLPVGADSAAFDVWQAQSLYADGVKMGAPPDDFNLKGQDWGLAVWNPDRLKTQGYDQFRTILQANMGRYKALRMDHVMALMRLFWIPPAKTPLDGAYVRYSFEDMLGIVCLESQKNQCIVIGEDLGTVPDEVRQELFEAGVLSYRLFYFEKNWQGDQDFKQPEDYPSQALVALTTHDLATLASFWKENDIKTRLELHLYPNERLKAQQIASREQDKKNLIQLLLDSDCMDEIMPEPCLKKLSEGIHRHLASTPSKILMIQLEDLWLQDKQVNLPGTVDEYPNWRIKLPKTIETLRDDPEVSAFFAKIASERKKEQ